MIKANIFTAVVLLCSLSACAQEADEDIRSKERSMDNDAGGATQGLEYCNWEDQNVETYHDRCVPIKVGETKILTWRNVIEVAAAFGEESVDDLLAANKISDPHGLLPKHSEEIMYGIYLKPPEER